MYEAALCSSTTETAQYFECAAARSAMSVSDSAKNVPANEDWKEQYESGMCIQNVSYAGADSFTIRTEPNFSRLSRMLLNSEACHYPSDRT